MYQLYFEDRQTPDIITAPARPKRYSFDPRLLKQMKQMKYLEAVGEAMAYDNNNNHHQSKKVSLSSGNFV